MPPKQRISVANSAFHRNVESRGNVKKSLKNRSAMPADPVIITVFVFIVCGSVILEVIRFIRMGIWAETSGSVLKEIEEILFHKKNR